MTDVRYALVLPLRLLMLAIAQETEARDTRYSHFSKLNRCRHHISIIAEVNFGIILCVSCAVCYNLTCHTYNAF